MGYKYIVDSGYIGGPPAPLHPAASRADWGRSTPGQEERGGDGGEMGEGNGFQIVVTSNPVSCVFTFS